VRLLSDRSGDLRWDGRQGGRYAETGHSPG
jgi:hypothetical protein